MISICIWLVENIQPPKKNIKLKYKIYMTVRKYSAEITQFREMPISQHKTFILLSQVRLTAISQKQFDIFGYNRGE